jgi:hypothetical protein
MTRLCRHSWLWVCKLTGYNGIKFLTEALRIVLLRNSYLPIRVAALYKAWTVFARSNAGIVGSIPIRGMDVCVYSVFLLGGGLVTGWSLVQKRVKDFLFSMSSRPALEFTQPPIQWVLETVSPGLKRRGREADHSPSNSAEVKKIWINTTTSPYAFMA